MYSVRVSRSDQLADCITTAVRSGSFDLYMSTSSCSSAATAAFSFARIRASSAFSALSCGGRLVELGLLLLQLVLGGGLLLAQPRLLPDQPVDLGVHLVDLGAQWSLGRLDPVELVLLLRDLRGRIPDRALADQRADHQGDQHHQREHGSAPAAGAFARLLSVRVRHRQLCGSALRAAAVGQANCSAADMSALVNTTARSVAKRLPRKGQSRLGGGARPGRLLH